jgi:hypothetical protein
MKYSMFQGISHPRIGEDLSRKNLTFYDIGESDDVVILIRNLMSDIVNPNKYDNISLVLEDFFKHRAIDINGGNETVNNILGFFDVYETHYINKTGFNFYLVKRNENKVLDVIDVWECKRKSRSEYAKDNRLNKFYNV